MNTVDEESRGLVDDAERTLAKSFTSRNPSQSISKLSRRCSITPIILVLVSSLLLNLILILQVSNHHVSPEEISRKANFYSPAIDHINLKLETRQFDGSFVPSTSYSGNPSPEVDAAWEEITDIRIGRITEDELDNSRFSRDHVSIPDEEGGFMAHFEFEHQLHCVNMLRMSTFFNYDHYHAEYPMMVNNHPLFRNHIRHCIEMLRQALVCNADLGVIPLLWLKNETRPVPDFNTWHVCKDFESVVNFVKGRRLPEMEMWGPKEGEIELDKAVYFWFEDEDDGNR